MGRILAPYGVRGWIKVKPQTEAIDGLLSYRGWWIGRGDAWQACRLVEGRVHGAGLIVHLEGFDDREKATAITGWRIAVPRAALPQAGEGEYYWCDLVGMTVVNLQREVLGRVEEIFATGANDVLVVCGDRERLIPFVESVVKRVEREKARLVVDWGSDY